MMVWFGLLGFNASATARLGMKTSYVYGKKKSKKNTHIQLRETCFIWSVQYQTMRRHSSEKVKRNFKI